VLSRGAACNRAANGSGRSERFLPNLPGSPRGPRPFSSSEPRMVPVATNNSDCVRCSMHRIFQTFIDHLAESSDVVMLRDSMADAAAALDLNCFAYLSVPNQPNLRPQHITTYPSSWTAHYLRNHYERLDPVITEALRSQEPFDWGLETGWTKLSKPQQRRTTNRFHNSRLSGRCRIRAADIPDFDPLRCRSCLNLDRASSCRSDPRFCDRRRAARRRFDGAAACPARAAGTSGDHPHREPHAAEVTALRGRPDTDAGRDLARSESATRASAPSR